MSTFILPGNITQNQEDSEHSRLHKQSCRLRIKSVAPLLQVKKLQVILLCVKAAEHIVQIFWFLMI